MKEFLVRPAEWLTDHGLTQAGRSVRNEYSRFCSYLESQGLAPLRAARVKYFLQSTMYYSLPEGYAIPPHTLNFTVNNQCNLKCSYCDLGQKSAKAFFYQYTMVDDKQIMEVPLETCKSIIDQAAWFRPVIRVPRREPLLYQHLLPLIEYTKEEGLAFSMLTNGFRLPKFADDLVRLKVDSIRMSLDGPEKTHDQISGVQGSYRRMIDGTKLLLEGRERRGTKMDIGYYYTMIDANYGSVLDTLDALEDEGLLSKVFVSFHWLVYTSEKIAKEHNALHGEICGGYIDESTVQFVDHTSVDPKVVARQAIEARRRYPASKGYRIHFRPSGELEDLIRFVTSEDFPVPSPRCKLPWYNLNINPAGEARVFSNCFLPSVGNVHDRSLMDLWNGPGLRSQRIKLQEHGAYKGCVRCWGLYSLLEDQHRGD